MTDLKEDYYFQFVPQYEKSSDYIDWKAYHSLMNVVVTFSAIDGKVTRFLTQWDLFPSAFNLLVILVRTDGEGMHLSKISELLAVSRANITGLVDVLARKGLVKRIASKTDRRVRLAILTDKGEALTREIMPQYYRYYADMCKDVSPEEYDKLISSLTKIRKHVSRFDESEG